MTFSKWAAVGAITLMTTGFCSAQQKFPLRAGEWEMSTSAGPGQAPMVMPFCLNDELWVKALNKSPLLRRNQPSPAMAQATALIVR